MRYFPNIKHFLPPKTDIPNFLKTGQGFLHFFLDFALVFRDGFHPPTERGLLFRTPRQYEHTCCWVLWTVSSCILCTNLFVHVAWFAAAHAHIQLSGGGSAALIYRYKPQCLLSLCKRPVFLDFGCLAHQPDESRLWMCLASQADLAGCVVSLGAGFTQAFYFGLLAWGHQYVLSLLKVYRLGVWLFWKPGNLLS